MSNEPVDIWKRLKKLSKRRIKICERIRCLNQVVRHRTSKLKRLGKKYNLITCALDQKRDELDEKQIDLLLEMLEHYGARIEQLTEDLSDLSEPTAELFHELDEVENQILALEAIVDAEVGSSDLD